MGGKLVREVLRFSSDILDRNRGYTNYSKQIVFSSSVNSLGGEWSSLGYFLLSNLVKEILRDKMDKKSYWGSPSVEVQYRRALKSGWKLLER